MKARIVPAIDLIDGRCVRLKQGDFSETHVVGGDPVEVARAFERQGFSRLHLVDLSGARSGKPQHLSVLKSICSATKLRVDYSGGLRATADLAAAFDAGAGQVVIGSAAVKHRAVCEEWLRSFGGDRIILGLDILDGYVRVSGWEEATDLELPTVVSWYLDAGLRYVMSTDISRDGMLEGPSPSLYGDLCARFSALSIIASGGVSSALDIFALAEQGVSEVIVGKALYAGSFALAEVQEFVW